MDFKYDINVPYNEKNILITIENIQKIFLNQNLHIKVNDMNLYIMAMTHKSYCKKSYSVIYPISSSTIPLMENDNERLEFLGDRVISVILAHYLFQRYYNESEGFITKLKTKIENRDMLAKLARKINLHNFLLISQQVENTNGRDFPKLLEDVFESFIGAVFLDQGFEFTNTFLRSIFNNTYFHYIDYAELLYLDNNYKDQLLKYYHTKSFNHPIYRIISCEGNINNRIFTVGLIDQDFINTYSNLESTQMNQYFAIGIGKTKKKAEQNCSKEALEKYRSI